MWGVWVCEIIQARSNRWEIIHSFQKMKWSSKNERWVKTWANVRSEKKMKNARLWIKHVQNKYTRTHRIFIGHAKHAWNNNLIGAQCTYNCDEWIWIVKPIISTLNEDFFMLICMKNKEIDSDNNHCIKSMFEQLHYIHKGCTKRIALVSIFYSHNDFIATVASFCMRILVWEFHWRIVLKIAMNKE